MPLDIIVDEDIYYSDEFKTIVRSCKEKILEGAQELALVDRSFVYAHRNNFYTFLRGIGIDERLVWPIAFINDIHDPSKGLMEKSSIYICTMEQINRLITHLKTVKKET